MNGSLLTGLVVALIGLVALPRAAFAATYYVSNKGDDAGAGVTEDAPLATLSEAARRAQAGDKILLRRGDVFRESVDVVLSGVELDAYGPPDAARPVVSGSVLITDWKPYKGAVYVADANADIGYLYADGKLMTIARYPNTGWLRTMQWREEQVPGQGRRRAGGKTFVTCPELRDNPRNAEGYWAGANIRWRHHSWWFETRPVLAYDGAGELTLGDRSFEATGPFDWAEKGWGFYMDGKLEELDAPGEYYFDPAAHKVYFYAPDGEDPNTLLIEGSARGTGLKIRDSAVRNIAFRHQKDVGLEVDGKCVVEHCAFESIGRDAPVSEHGAGGAALSALRGVRETAIRDNEFRNNLNHSIQWWQNRDAQGDSVIERNTIEHSGTVPAYGGSGSWHAVGILIGTGANVHITHNRIDGTGYAGILLGTAGNFAEYNVIRNAMATLNDGAGIYTNCSRSTIRHNIILDAKGGMESSGSWPDISHGIWLEFLGNYRESVVEGNTCAGCGADGIFLTNNYKCIIRDNVLYNNDRYQLLLSGRGEEQSPESRQDHLIEGNVLYAVKSPQKLLYFDPRFDYGTLRGNCYVCPWTEESVVAGTGWPGGGGETSMSLAAWRKDCAWADSAPRVVAPVAAGAPDRSELFINDTEAAKAIPLTGAYTDLDGKRVEGTIELAPFSSRVLIKPAGG